MPYAEICLSALISPNNYIKNLQLDSYEKQNLFTGKERWYLVRPGTCLYF